MEGIQNPVVSRSVEEVFGDFRGRRAGLLKALSTDVRKFYHECDPGAEAAEEAMVKHIIEAFSTTSDQPIAKAGEDESDERFLDFMKEGACNELFTALLDLDCGE
ncbi:hypothetical protein F2Q68_00042353 [Brassica cretica]|uniref:Alfin N-terminal domain-containing protein n=1 Tax=Brassica cretica TaxID=69181 RepID=A0A8S9MLW7_BRACR|nr:hypothetical protein F2Q68_00042353 [Brassica cretica]